MYHNNNTINNNNIAITIKRVKQLHSRKNSTSQLKKIKWRVKCTKFCWTEDSEPVLQQAFFWTECVCECVFQSNISSSSSSLSDSAKYLTSFLVRPDRSLPESRRLKLFTPASSSSSSSDAAFFGFYMPTHTEHDKTLYSSSWVMQDPESKKK